MIRRYAIVLLFICLSQTSCSDSGPKQECLTSDSVAVIDTLSVENQTYFLSHRISGWHEKIESFELYNAQPTFNSCGESSIQLLFGASVDNQDANNNNQHVAHIYLKPPNELVFDYKSGPPPNASHYENLTLELQNLQ